MCCNVYQKTLHEALPVYPLVRVCVVIYMISDSATSLNIYSRVRIYVVIRQCLIAVMEKVYPCTRVCVVIGSFDR